MICMLCEENLENYTTKCGHNFCYDCFNRWNTGYKQNCPVCRSHLPSSRLFLSKEEININDLKLSVCLSLRHPLMYYQSDLSTLKCLICR